MKKKIIAGALHAMPKSRAGIAPVRLHLLLLIFLLTIVFTACGGGSGGGGGSNSGGGTEPTAATAVIDSAGGTLTGPDGVQVVVPPGALNQPTEIGIARKSEGAPAALDAYPAAGNIYEFTPHDLPFNLPVTIRMPVPSSASGTLFMASPGQDWNVTGATVVNGMAVWERGSFSWVYWSSWSHMGGTGCSIPTSMLNDPYWCGVPVIGASLSATPPQALTQIPVSPYYYFGRVDQAAVLHFQSQFYVPGNCGNVTVELFRRRFNGFTLPWGWGPRQLLSTQSPALTVDGSRLSGTATFDLPFTNQDNGKSWFELDLSTDCPGVLRANDGTVVGYDYSNYHNTGALVQMHVEGNIAPPTVFYTVGGSVTGLTGTGLVLQNNGGDNLAVAADGAFTFATSVGAGSSYNVTVFTQPTQQTCTVINGSGTANADVTNVAVSCGALALAVSSSATSATGCADPNTVTFTASGGTPPYSWSTSEGGSTNLTVINSTQVRWRDTSDNFCGTTGTVTITVTDSTGASASATIQVN